MPRKASRMAYVGHQTNSIFVDEFVNGGQKRLLLDSGATKTIDLPDVLKRTVDVKPTKWRLRTTTGSARIHGEAMINLQIGKTSIKHQTLVADIKNEVIPTGQELTEGAS